MRSFFRGLLVGIGIGLLVAPMRGEELRRLLSERIQELRGYLPENEQLNQYVQQVGERVSQASSNLRDYAQQAASKVRETSSTLGTLGQQAATTVKQTGQDVAQTTKQTAQSAKQQSQTDISSTSGGPTS